MNEQNINATQMVWRPPLIKLTQISNPDLDGGVPTEAWIDPGLIIRICRSKGAFMRAPEFEKRHDLIDCTEVHCGHVTLLVLESPAEVAALRDRVFGVQHKPVAVK